MISGRDCFRAEKMVSPISDMIKEEREEEFQWCSVSNLGCNLWEIHMLNLL